MAKHTTRRPISQREARALRKRVRELETLQRQQRTTWGDEWPDAVIIGGLQLDTPSLTIQAVHTARRLKHAVVAVPTDGNKALIFFALPLPV